MSGISSEVAEVRVGGEERVLEMEGICKSFPGVRALHEVSFDLRHGEVHALVGENGAGKSTLIKILAGALERDAGEIRVGGEVAHLRTPQAAIATGISVIYQEFNLVPHLSVAENIYLGREPRQWGLIDFRTMRQGARALLDRLRASFSETALVNELSVAEQQMVEIAKALSVQSKVLVMDEPSATLTEHELASLFEQIRGLKNEGVSIIYISHRLEEVFEIADRVTVLRDGELVGTAPVAELDSRKIIRMMVGRDIGSQESGVRSRENGERRTAEELLRVEGLARGAKVKGVSFTLGRGEILGIAGLVGAGRTELVRAIFGADRPTAGQIYLEGRPVRPKSPAHAIALGIGLVPEDRKLQGLVLGLAVSSNVTLARLGAVSSAGILSGRQERQVAEEYIGKLDIATPSAQQISRNLSGGNQQKVVLAKWLFAQSKVLIFDEPTRGIDVGAKQEIYQIMRDVANTGAGVIMISSDLPEILRMSDRIMVMHEGEVAGFLRPEEATQERIMTLATGEDGSAK
ncbi:MAG: sugar ABC transporter ATP-binding protein [Armatimonadetes bacterium]|nr:sugar ABC transporter ATP-binding protein [Armatimonadota bacterium]